MGDIYASSASSVGSTLQDEAQDLEGDLEEEDNTAGVAQSDLHNPLLVPELQTVLTGKVSLPFFDLKTNCIALH